MIWEFISLVLWNLKAVSFLAIHSLIGWYTLMNLNYAANAFRVTVTQGISTLYAVRYGVINFQSRCVMDSVPSIRM